MDALWDALRDRLGLDALRRQINHIHEHDQRQENAMAKLSDELDDIARRQTAIKDAIAASATNLRTAIDKLTEQVADLSDGELNSEQQAKVDAIKATADEIRTAAESADDGFEPPIVEPSPFPADDDGSTETGQRGTL